MVVRLVPSLLAKSGKALLLNMRSFSPEIIKNEIGDYTDRTFYLSGPNAMVMNYKKMLLGMEIPAKNIHTDYFPGF